MIDYFEQEKSLFKENDLVCYCFHYSRTDIEKDYMENSRSTIFEKITREKKTGGCECAQKNPKGR